MFCRGSRLERKHLLLVLLLLLLLLLLLPLSIVLLLPLLVEFLERGAQGAFAYNHKKMLNFQMLTLQSTMCHSI